MNNEQPSNLAPNRICTVHRFHIPVMGTGFTIDTPLKVARYGISSVVSLVDDVLIEKIHLHHARIEGESHEAIDREHPDARAQRITSYLNFLGRTVQRQIIAMKALPFTQESEITRYFELLPDSELKHIFQEMLETPESDAKERMQGILREKIEAGSIDVNIMTKLDASHSKNGVPAAPESSDALSALRGYAKSDLDSAIIFSAGLNPRLFAYASEFLDFHPNAEGHIKKRIILKVSDYRSASIQGRYLAKRGLWVSEFRIESGLNCGGHAFATGGQLMGPILEEFKQKRQELSESLWKTCQEVWKNKGITVPEVPLNIRVTAQGGIGTSAEHNMLIACYGVDATGWASPFLLAPDVTAVNDDVLQRLLTAKPSDFYLSDNSPIGIPFWNLRNSPSEEVRLKRVEEGRPGTSCPKGYLRFNQTLTESPVCLASREYQKLKLSAARNNGVEFTKDVEDGITTKACICHELGGSALQKYGIDSKINAAICPGPNIVYFRRLTNLKEMVDHIYGRISLIDENSRPHMFIQELRINIEYLKNWLSPDASNGIQSAIKTFREFADTLFEGIRYYREKMDDILPLGSGTFQDWLNSMEVDLTNLFNEVKS